MSPVFAALLLLCSASALHVEPWLRARGVEFGKSISIGASDGLRGLVSTAPIAAGDVLCSAPLASALHVELADADWLWDLARLVLAAPEGYAEWYASLRDDLETLPLLWPIEDLPYCYAPVCERLFLVQTQAGLRGGDARAWTEAAACVLSRAFVVDAATPLAVLSPGADLVNHAPEPPGASPFFLDGDRVGVRASSAAPPGAATVSYAARASNDRLFANYGFVQRDNADDEYVLEDDLRLFRGGAWSRRSAERLRARASSDAAALELARGLLRDEADEVEAGLEDARGRGSDRAALVAAFLAEKLRVLEEGLAAEYLWARNDDA